MKKLFEGMSKGILYFLAGVFFTLFIFSFIVVVYLFNENNRLRVEMDGIKDKVNNMELKKQVEEIEQPQQVLQTTEPEEEKPISPKQVGINWVNWRNLKRNLTADEVTNLIGKPTQIISKIDTTKYIYKDERSEGTIDFNRLMRVISWER